MLALRLSKRRNAPETLSTDGVAAFENDLDLAAAVIVIIDNVTPLLPRKHFFVCASGIRIDGSLNPRAIEMNLHFEHRLALFEADKNGFTKSGQAR
jgi:hypothetical protein